MCNIVSVFVWGERRERLVVALLCNVVKMGKNGINKKDDEKEKKRKKENVFLLLLVSLSPHHTSISLLFSDIFSTTVTRPLGLAAAGRKKKKIGSKDPCKKMGEGRSGRTF